MCTCGIHIVFGPTGCMWYSWNKLVILHVFKLHGINSLNCIIPVSIDNPWCLSFAYILLLGYWHFLVVLILTHKSEMPTWQSAFKLEILNQTWCILFVFLVFASVYILPSCSNWTIGELWSSLLLFVCRWTHSEESPWKELQSLVKCMEGSLWDRHEASVYFYLDLLC